MDGYKCDVCDGMFEGGPASNIELSINDKQYGCRSRKMVVCHACVGFAWKEAKEGQQGDIVNHLQVVFLERLKEIRSDALRR